jgi:1-acyl-sn-glycerol-3-phosphate acyltransferase
MNFIRSLIHMAWMTITVIPWALVVVVASLFISSNRLYWWYKVRKSIGLFNETRL